MKLIQTNQNGYKTDIQKEIHTFSGTTGQQLGLQGLPKTYAEYNALFFNLLKSKIHSYITEIELEKTPKSQMAIAKAKQHDKNDAVRILRAGLLNDIPQRVALQDEIEKMPFTKMIILQYCFVKGTVVLLSFAESFLVYSAFRSNGIPTIGAVIASLAIGAGLYKITDSVASFLLSASKPIIRWVRGLCVTLITFLFFFGIAKLRVSSMHNETEINKRFSKVPVATVELPVYTLALISTGMFLVGVLLVMAYGLSNAEKEEIKQYFKKSSKLRKLKRKIFKINQTIAQKESEAFNVSKQALITFDETNISKKLLHQYGNEGVAIFISANLNHRTDGYCPDFYASPELFEITDYSPHQNND